LLKRWLKTFLFIIIVFTKERPNSSIEDHLGFIIITIHRKHFSHNLGCLFLLFFCICIQPLWRLLWRPRSHTQYYMLIERHSRAHHRPGDKEKVVPILQLLRDDRAKLQLFFQNFVPTVLKPLAWGQTTTKRPLFECLESFGPHSLYFGHSKAKQSRATKLEPFVALYTPNSFATQLWKRKVFALDMSFLPLKKYI
jgi:hypothetical protein